MCTFLHVHDPLVSLLGREVFYSHNDLKQVGEQLMEIRDAESSPELN